MRILVTGATGFVGSVLCEALTRSGHIVRAAMRTERSLPNIAERVVIGNLDSQTDWAEALDRVDCVVHAAARAHVLGDPPSSAKLYFETNVRGTARLAAVAAARGVDRFIFLSTIKVNGEQTASVPFRATDEPKPEDAYGTSKWLAEQVLMEEAARSGLRVATIRPPLVYGPGVRANFLRLLRWVERGAPLPLGIVRNVRSVVSVWNLCDLIRHVIESPSVLAGTYLVADAEQVSTPELIHRIAQAMNKHALLLPVPVALLRLAGALTGKSAEVARLCGSLQVDAGPTSEQLSWTPPMPMQEALKRTVDWYLSDERNAH